MKRAFVIKTLTGLTLAAAAVLANPAQASWREWKITKTAWSASDERNFSQWVQALGESGCNTVDRCLKSKANYYATNEERSSVGWYGDCGRFPYILRAYFSWKNGLPFGFANGAVTVEGSTASKDLKYGAKGNIPTSRSSIVQRSADKLIDGPAAVENAVDQVYTANYRYNPNSDVTKDGLFFDFYSPAITRDQIRPGTAIYDPNGHVVVVYKVEDDGRVKFFDAHPDNTVSHSTYGEKFVRSSMGMGAGFKNFRPIQLVGAKQLDDGRYIGGRITTIPLAQTPGFSTEQFIGTNPVEGSWSKGAFVVNGSKLQYYDFVRTRLAVGELKYHPVEEMVNAMDTLCQDIQDRLTAVNEAISKGIDQKSQPSNLPGNIYGTDGEWESYSTPSRDARLKTSFREVRTQTELFVKMYREGSERIIYEGNNLISDLRRAYEDKAASCEISYVKSNGQKQVLTYDDVVQRLFALSFDPYHCVERRWGASSRGELASCADGKTKQAWYAAEQGLRNQLDRKYDAKMGFDLGDLQSGAEGTGVSTAPDVDLKGFLDRQ